MSDIKRRDFLKASAGVAAGTASSVTATATHAKTSAVCQRLARTDAS